MDDDLPEAQSSGDSVIAEEAHQLPAKLHRQPQESRRLGCMLWLAVGLAIAGPFAALVAAMSADELVLPITVGSCGLAGLTLASVSRGIRGALVALALPLGWLVVAVALVPLAGEAPAETIGLVLGFVLIQAASAEAGYLIGRFVAGLIRRPTSAASAR